VAAAAPKPPEKPATVAPVPTPPAPKTVKTVFTLKAPAAKQVLVCGEFNGWQPEAAPMTRRADGTWETSLALHPGRYQYKFVVDGNWIHDPNAKINVPNEHHSLNSVIEVRA
jgi:1,4-alpha-glucan branching enzyme